MDSSKKNIKTESLNIQKMDKTNSGEDLRLLYIPDFEQDIPTYPHVISEFVNAFSDTNTELLLYVREDEFLEDKLAVLDSIFANYEKANCYINLYVGTLDDESGLFEASDGYVTNKSDDNAAHMQIADRLGLTVYSGQGYPIFKNLFANNAVNDNGDIESNFNESMILNVLKQQNTVISKLNSGYEELINRTVQLSTNQVAMNNAFDNMKYEILHEQDRPQYPKVLSGDFAIEKIINEGKSMSRFGDGEFSVMLGIDRQRFQRADEKLAKRLREVLESKQDNVLVCLFDAYGDLSKYNAETKYNIRAYFSEETRRRHYELIDMDREYYDANVTRPYASYIDNNTDAPKKRFDNLKRIWKDKKLLIIEGEKTRLGVGNDLFAGAKEIKRILGPAEHAFDKYDELLEEAIKFLDKNNDYLTLIALGATATVLAYDIAMKGYQALDIGHVDIEYEWMLAGTGRKVPVKGKYNNEVSGGNIVEDIDDPAYEKEIIARLYNRTL